MLGKQAAGGKQVVGKYIQKPAPGEKRKAKERTAPVVKKKKFEGIPNE